MATKMNNEQKAAYVESKKESFLSSGKTSTPEYIEKFNKMSIEEQFLAIRRKETYEERKNNETKKVTKSTNPLNMLINGEKPELATDYAEALIEKFSTAIATLQEIIQENKANEKKDIENQIKELQERLKQMK